MTGIAALVLSARNGLTCDQVKQILIRTARRNGAAVGAPDDTWGAGRVDAASAVALARAAVFPTVLSVTVAGAVLKIQTDVPTTAAVRFNRLARRLELGRANGSRAQLTPGTQHTVSLAGLTAGRYFAEVVVFGSDNFSTTDDRQGQFYEVTVP